MTRRYVYCFSLRSFKRVFRRLKKKYQFSEKEIREAAETSFSNSMVCFCVCRSEDGVLWMLPVTIELEWFYTIRPADEQNQAAITDKEFLRGGQKKREWELAADYYEIKQGQKP